jgi:glutaminyl-tRNA synthetase
MSKRKLLELVDKAYVRGWDDPRLPTLAGLRRRGYTPEAIRNFAELVGVAKRESMVDMALLEHCLREDLNKSARRVMAVLRPLKVVISNYPEGKVEEVDAENNPEDPGAGMRKLPFSRELYIEQDDFREDPPKKYFRLSPGKEIRLKHAYYIRCDEVIKDKAGCIAELRCSYDPESRGGSTKDGRKVLGTSHWVSSAHAVDAEVRLYDKLLSVPDPSAEKGENDFKEYLNPASLEILKGCKVERSLAEAKPGDFFQFLRQGYFCVDADSTPEMPVFNRSVSLRDSWTKIEKSQQGK